jgi:signal transduction histidine kinase/DNA-binding NarL/FixJ family response regulator
LLIALVLHGATALDLSRYLLRYQTEQRQLSEQIAERLSGYIKQVKLSASMVTKMDPALVLPMLASQQPEFISTLLTDAEGKVQAFYKADLPDNITSGGDVSDRSYFSHPRSTGQAFISDTFLGRRLGNDQLFAVSAPVWDTSQHNDFAGVLEVSVNLQALTATIVPTDADISHRVLLDKELKKIWGTHDDRPLGQRWSVNPQSDLMTEKFMQHSWFNSFGAITLTKDAAHIVLSNHVEPSQWQLKYYIDTDRFLKRYYSFLAIALLVAMLLLETITALSRSFIARYTASLERLADSAAMWQPEAPPQRRLQFQHSAAEIETLSSTILDMQSRVHQSRDAMQASMQEIVNLNNELENRVQNRTEELRQERDKANQLAAIKLRFLANMSHEIRTPITVIKGFTEQLLRHSDDTQHVIIQRILQNTSHLQRLVDDILDTAKIDEGKMRLEQQFFDLHNLIINLTDSIESLALQKGLTFKVDAEAAAGLELWADPFRLKQILLNLLSNAIKFTSQGEIRLSLSRLPDGDLTISVIDQGIGISASQLPLLFKAFSQADNSTSRHFGGTGLGLYISQQLAEAMQLNLSVVSTEGHGSRFTLRLPAVLLQQNATDHTRNITTKPAISSLRPARLLIVDDVADIRALLASYLSDFPLHLTFAADGNAAVALCQQQVFDLIIMDQQMPELDGLQATLAIRALGIKTPVLSLSADVFVEQSHQSAGLFQQTMSKPFDRNLLLQNIAALLDAFPPNATATGTEHSFYATQTTETPVNMPGRASREDIPTVIAPGPDDELLLEYRQSLSVQADQLAALLTQSDWPAIQLMLHKIKGTSACFGLDRLSKQAALSAQQLKMPTPDLQALTELIALLKSDQSE